MVRTAVGLALFFWAAVASAEPPADRDVLAKAKVPVACDAVIVKSSLMKGLLLPVPGLGFVPVPVEWWRCDVWHTPRNAPAGAPKRRDTVRLFTLAGE